MSWHGNLKLQSSHSVTLFLQQCLSTSYSFRKLQWGIIHILVTMTLAVPLLKTTWHILLTSLFHSAINLYSPRKHSKFAFDFFVTYNYSFEFFTSNFVYLTFTEGHHHRLAIFGELMVLCLYWLKTYLALSHLLVSIAFKTPISLQGHCLQSSRVTDISI